MRQGEKEEEQTEKKNESGSGWSDYSCQVSLHVTSILFLSLFHNTYVKTVFNTLILQPQQQNTAFQNDTHQHFLIRLPY